jgi:hypothetical protein
MLVLLLSGKAQSGKDTLAEFVKEYAELVGKKAQRIAYADAVKELAYQFGWDGQKDEKGRRLLQLIGTEVGRGYNPNIWIDKGVEKLKTAQLNGVDIVCITDCRYPNEIEAIKSLEWVLGKVVTVRIERHGAGAGENANHVSETSLDDWQFDHTVENDTSLWCYRENTFWLLSDLMEEQNESVKATS